MKCTIEQVRALLETWSKSKLTAEVKKNIVDTAKEYNVKVRTNTRCSNCWHDALIELYAAMKKTNVVKSAVEKRAANRTHVWKSEKHIVRLLNKQYIDRGEAFAEELYRHYREIYDKLYVRVEPQHPTESIGEGVESTESTEQVQTTTKEEKTAVKPLNEAHDEKESNTSTDADNNNDSAEAEREE